MGDFDGIHSIVVEVKTMKNCGMNEEEITLVLEQDGVEPAYIKTALRRALVS